MIAAESGEHVEGAGHHRLVDLRGLRDARAAFGQGFGFVGFSSDQWGEGLGAAGRAPIHPFWPAGDRGITDKNGEVALSLPMDFWFYFGGVDAEGYTEIKDEDETYRLRNMVHLSSYPWGLVFMKRQAAGDAR